MNFAKIVTGRKQNSVHWSLLSLQGCLVTRTFVHINLSKMEFLVRLCRTVAYIKRNQEAFKSIGTFCWKQLQKASVPFKNGKKRYTILSVMSEEKANLHNHSFVEDLDGV